MASDWSVHEFFYGNQQPTQYGFFRSDFLNSRGDSFNSGSGSFNSRSLDRRGSLTKAVSFHRSDSNISDHYDKTVDLDVPLCCESCGTRIRDALIDLEGVIAVTLDYNEGRVTLRGEVSPKEALEVIKKIKPKATHRVHAKNVVYKKTAGGGSK